MLKPLEINRREQRAHHLASEMVRTLDLYLPRATRGPAFDALMKLFYDADVEIITRVDRKTAGLPERNELGLTPEEHRVIELQKLHALTASPTPILFCLDCPHKPRSPEAGSTED